MKSSMIRAAVVTLSFAAVGVLSLSSSAQDPSAASGGGGCCNINVPPPPAPPTVTCGKGTHQVGAVCEVDGGGPPVPPPPPRP